MSIYRRLCLNWQNGMRTEPNVPLNEMNDDASLHGDFICANIPLHIFSTTRLHGMITNVKTFWSQLQQNRLQCFLVYCDW